MRRNARYRSFNDETVVHHMHQRNWKGPHSFKAIGIIQVLSTWGTDIDCINEVVDARHYIEAIRDEK